MIRPLPSRRRPFQSLTSAKQEVEKLLQAEHDAVPVMLNDWTHDLSDTVYAQYFQTGVFPYCVDSLLANGYGRVECLPESILMAGTGLGLDSSSMTVMGMNSSSMGGSSMGDSSMDASSMSHSSKAMSPKGMSMGDSGTQSKALQVMAMSGSTMDSIGQSGDSQLMSPIARRQTSPTMVSMPAINTEPSAISSMPATSSGNSMSGMSGMPAMSGMSSMSATPTASSMGSMSSMQPMTTLNPKGCTPPMMANPGYNLSFAPLQTCTNTTSPLLRIPANHTLGWLSLHLVNSGAVSNLAVSLDGHSMFVYAADGLYVGLKEVNVSVLDVPDDSSGADDVSNKVVYIEIGQRYSVMVKLNQRAGNYYLRFQSFPMGDMQQVIEGQAVVEYTASST